MFCFYHKAWSAPLLGERVTLAFRAFSTHIGLIILALLINNGLIVALFVASFACLYVFIVPFFVAGPDQIKSVAGWNGKIQE